MSTYNDFNYAEYKRFYSSSVTVEALMEYLSHAKTLGYKGISISGLVDKGIAEELKDKGCVVFTKETISHESYDVDWGRKYDYETNTYIY